MFIMLFDRSLYTLENEGGIINPSKEYISRVNPFIYPFSSETLERAFYALHFHKSFLKEFINVFSVEICRMIKPIRKDL